MSGIELVAAVIAAFFACGIVAGVLAVIALSALRGHRARGEQHRGFGEYDPNRTQPIDWHPPAGPGRPPDPDWEDRSGWTELRGPGEGDDLPPPWPGRRG